MDEITAMHFETWLEQTQRPEDADGIRTDIREVLDDHPDLIEKSYSWPEMLRMARYVPVSLKAIG